MPDPNPYQVDQTDFVDFRKPNMIVIIEYFKFFYSCGPHATVHLIFLN